MTLADASRRMRTLPLLAIALLSHIACTLPTTTEEAASLAQDLDKNDDTDGLTEADAVTANAIAPAARTRMTEAIFDMDAPETGFDANDPANISPLVAWLASRESSGVTGRVFEVEGGTISVADGWQHGPSVDRGERWDAADVGAAVHDLLAKAPPAARVYGTS